MDCKQYLNELVEERNSLVKHNERIEASEARDIHWNFDRVIEQIQNEIADLKKNRTVFKLTDTDIEEFEEKTAADINDIIPAAEKNGKDIEPITITIGNRIIEIPLNAGTYGATIEAIKKCLEIENE